MSEKLRIIIAQLNFLAGDISGNAQKIITAIKKARDEMHGDLILFPELALTGYSPEDLLLRSDFKQAVMQALEDIQQHTTGIDVVLGYPASVANKIYNAACVIRDQEIIANYYKQCLPNYGIFDEKRYFITANQPCVFSINNVKCGLIICEDMWFPEPSALIKQADAQLILCLNGSPFDIKKPIERIRVAQARIKENKIPVVYAQGVYGQDDVIFDGGSFAMDATGSICTQAEYFVEQLFPVDIKSSPALEIVKTSIPTALSDEAKAYQALVLAVRDYVNKNNFAGALVGSSGGIDSALTLAIAVDALGKDRVEAVMLPSRFTSELSVTLAKKQIELLGIQAREISIEPSFQAFINSLQENYADSLNSLTKENLQARCRGTLLMALSNQSEKILLNTTNKSELAMGYGTLYGDMAGGYAVLKDVPKTLVYKLADFRNGINPVIPAEIITRPPTAELAPNQKDEDSLPPYAVLDAILQMYVEEDCSLLEIVNQGFPEDIVRKVITTVEKNEYKRRQAAPGPRITSRAFGRERRYPITSKFNK